MSKTKIRESFSNWSWAHKNAFLALPVIERYSNTPALILVCNNVRLVSAFGKQHTHTHIHTKTHKHTLIQIQTLSDMDKFQGMIF